VQANNKQESMATFEFERLLLCASPYVLGCYGMAPTEGGSWLLLLEHAPYGDIESYYSRFKRKGDGTLEIEDKGGEWPLSKRFELIYQLVQALEHMHSLGVYHRDLKPRNIMLSSMLTILLGDFGGTTDQEHLDEQAEKK
jgi:serine/threonine protein kinase